MKRIVILGAGTAGTMMANRLVRLLPDGWQVVLLDRDDTHVYQPGLLFLPFGAYREAELVRPAGSSSTLPSFRSSVRWRHSSSCSLPTHTLRSEAREVCGVGSGMADAPGRR